MAVQVVIEDHTGNVRHPVRLSETATIDRLIRAIITTLNLPITDPAGRSITYYLAHNNRRLQDNDTLASAEVREGDTLTIVPQMTAGGGPLSPQHSRTLDTLVKRFLVLSTESTSEQLTRLEKSLADIQNALNRVQLK